MEHKIIYEKDGIIIQERVDPINGPIEGSYMTTLFTTIEPGAYKSITYFGSSNEVDNREHLAILLKAVENHYKNKGQKMKGMIYELREGIWKWYDA
jgi:hypothetical protein